MSKYRINVSLDDQNHFWVVVDKGVFIKNPTDDDLKDSKLYYYNNTNVCPRCREENEIDIRKLTDDSILYPGNIGYEKNKNMQKTGRIICARHWRHDYKKYDHNSTENIIKSLSDRRTGVLKYYVHIFADNYEDLTLRWLGAKRLSLELDKFSRLPLDHLPIPNEKVIDVGGKLINLSGKIVQTKGKSYNDNYGGWVVNCIREWDKKFDYLILYSTNKDGNIIERIYIIPIGEIYDLLNKKGIRKSIGIYKSPSRGVQWYEKYRVTDKEIIKVNKIWEQLMKDSNKKFCI